MCRESAAGDGAFGGCELVGDVADGFAAFGEATHDFVLFGDREVFEAHADGLQGWVRAGCCRCGSLRR